MGRESDWREIRADKKAAYDEYEVINLSDLEPLIACPSSPGNVAPVREVAGKKIYQAYIGSSANSGLRDFAVPAMMVDGRQINDRISFDINSTSRQLLENLIGQGFLEKLVHAGARVHQPGCNGCIGMGQAPATGQISLRTVPRNFPGRSGTEGDRVYLCSPETATASAITGVITDPRTLAMDYPLFREPEKPIINTAMLIPPHRNGRPPELEIGPNIKPLPKFDPLPGSLEGPVLLKVGDNISTDEIMPAGSRILPFRSNIPEISKFSFIRIDETFYDRAVQYREKGYFILGGENYGQGSSREHAVIGPRYLGLRAVIAKSFARIHRQNLINFGILPLTFANKGDYDSIEQNDTLKIENLRQGVSKNKTLTVTNRTRKETYTVIHSLNDRQIDMVLNGGLINVIRGKR